jgi:hypothetical protein
VLAEHHADVVLPCAEYFNPGWEMELGTCEGVLQHRREFQRKIDPVVNGITDMEKYKPIETIKTEKPTVVMLSHIRYVFIPMRIKPLPNPRSQVANFSSDMLRILRRLLWLLM